MDRDDEIDKILKQKFENKILPSEEFENNIKANKANKQQQSQFNQNYALRSGQQDQVHRKPA